ncbi:MAG: rhodanese-like domain-containing protein [Campylobacterales bacterium]|nr:rhodanese-like domain-containing protein [Campylobacterales bacterium]
MINNISKKLGLALTVSTLLVGNVSANSEYDTLTKYMAENNLDMNKVMDRKTWIPHAAVLVENIKDYTILDIREGDIAPKNGIEDFEDGHIAGAINTSFKNILKTANKINSEDNILVVSHDGQAAAAAAVALRLSGYPTTKVLKFGMSGWNNKFDVWSAHQTDQALNSKNWTMTDAKKPKKYSKKPNLNTSKSTGKEILAARVNKFLENGFNTIEAKDLLANANAYYVVNQGSKKAYGKYGRVDGAHQFKWPMINPKKGNGSLSNYPTDRNIVQYCWTGHAAISVSSWMNVLGYQAKGMSFGVNDMFISKMKEKKFKKPSNLSYVTGK